MLVIPATGWGIRQILRACWPLSLAEKVNFQSIERPCAKLIRQTAIGEAT